MIRHALSRRALSWALVSFSTWAAPALAQDQVETPAPSGKTASDSLDGDAIVVTGRAGASAQKKVQTSYAISTISEKDLQMRAPIGVAEALKDVPGFFVENTSGEASGGVRIRGIPGDGYANVTVLEDGLPIQGDAGLGWLNADQSLRMDQTIERIEVVRGGPSSIFYSNAPGAAINFITRRGTDHFEGLLRYEATSWNDHRVDGWISGPIADSGWNYFAGGYYRIGDGQRNTGYTTAKGGQVRATISRKFDRGSVMFGVKRIDERIPNWGGGIYTYGGDGKVESVSGFNDKRDTIDSDETRKLTFLTNDGNVQFDAGKGTTVKLTQLTFAGDYELSDAIKVEHSMRYRSSYTQRQSITPYSVANASDLISATYGSYVGSGESLGLNYADDGSAFGDNQNGNGLALINLARIHTVPLNEFISDTKFLVQADFLGHHNLAFGGYFASESEGYKALSAAVLTDVRDNARLLDVTLQDGAGNSLYKFTNNGIMQYGAEFADSKGDSQTLAAYASDEWQVTDKLRFDGGLRYEHIHVTGQVEGSASHTVDGYSTTGGSGAWTPFSNNYSHTAWTAGVNYQLQPNFGAFARYTKTFRLPNISSFITSPNADPVVQTMNFLEGGLKFSSSHADLYVTGFRTIYNSYEIDDYVRDSSGSLVYKPYYGNTRTWGVELEGAWRPVDWFDVRANYTWQNARFTKFDYTSSAGVFYDYSQNRLVRTPAHIVRVTPAFNLLQEKLRLQSTVTYTSQRWVDVANSENLPGFWNMDVNVQYNLNDRLQFNLMVNNLTNELGLLNGNARAGDVQNSEAGQDVFIGSSLYGRSMRGVITYRF